MCPDYNRVIIEKVEAIELMAAAQGRRLGLPGSMAPEMLLDI